MCESSAVHAVALLGPVAKEHHVRQFEVPGVNLFTGNELDPTDQPDAALIFGGDGTIHRHLGGLALKQIPTLIVPLGSANDFAHSVGVETVEKALASWRRFCASGDNTHSIDLGTIEPLDERSKSGDADRVPWQGESLESLHFVPDGPRRDPLSGAKEELGGRIMQSQLRRLAEAEREVDAHHIFWLHRRHWFGCSGEPSYAEAAAMVARTWRVRRRAAAGVGRFSSATHHGVGRSGWPLGDARGPARIPDRRW